MKKTVSFLLLFPLVFLQACTDDWMAPVSEASLNVEFSENEEGSRILRIVPNESTVRFEYFMDEGVSDLDAFVSGDCPSIFVEGNEPLELLLEDMSFENGTCAVLARAFDAEGRPSPVFSKSVTDGNVGFSVEMTYLTESSAGFLVRCNSDFENVRYYLGEKSEKEAFESGEIEGEYIHNILEYSGVNYFDLEPGTEYVFYTVAYDRGGIPLYEEFPFTTYSSQADCPSANYEMVSSDAYKTVFKIVPNEKAYMVAAIVLEKDNATDSQVLYGPANGRGYLEQVFLGWINIEKMKASVDKEFDYEWVNQTFTLDMECEIFLALFDESGDMTGLYRHDIVVSPYVEDAGMSSVELQLSNITSKGATYTITANENTMGFYYDTVDAIWFDQMKESPSYNEFFIHEMLYKSYSSFSYGKQQFVYSEVSGNPNTRYYATACPVNINGPLKGWGDAVMIEFTTKNE